MKNLFRFIIAVTVFCFLPHAIKAQWVKTSYSAGNSVYSLATDGNNIFAGSLEGKVFVSNNNGVGWTSISNGLPIYAPPHGSPIRSVFINGNNMFAGPQMHGLFISQDNGQNWKHIDATAFDKQSIFCIIQFGSNLLIGTSNGGVFKSMDFGNTWTNMIGPKTVLSLAAQGSTVLAGTTGEGIVSSSDNGTTWTSSNSGINPLPQDVYAVAISGQALLAGVTGGLYRSTDNGANWVMVTNGLQIGLQNPTILSLVSNGSNVLAGTEGQGIYLSKNNGESWVPFSQGIQQPFTVYAVIIAGAYIYAASFESGIWKRPLNDVVTSVGNENARLPESYLLEQNYPNPFNPSTVINYQLPVYGRVELKIFDVLGREVSTLVNEEKSPGKYQVQWNGTNSFGNFVSSGIYFYRLTSGKFTEIKKMVLIK